MGLPARIFADNQSIITSNFTTQLRLLSGIEQHQSVIYYPSPNGRGEAAVRSVVMALQKYLHQQAGKWVQALPPAVWGLNNLPSRIAPYSPHRLVFGRDPVAFGDIPPFVPEDGAGDALGLFQRVAAKRMEGCDRLTKIHDRILRDSTAKYKAQGFEEADKVWVRVRLDERRFDKLERIWQGPYEVRCWVGVIDMRSSLMRVGSPVVSKSSNQIASSRMYRLCRDALFPVGITPSGPYPPQMTHISFNRWLIIISWDEVGGATFFLWLPGRGILIELTKIPPSLLVSGRRELRNIYIPMGCAGGFTSWQSEHL